MVDNKNSEIISRLESKVSAYNQAAENERGRGNSELADAYNAVAFDFSAMRDELEGTKSSDKKVAKASDSSSNNTNTTGATKTTTTSNTGSAANTSSSNK